MPTLHAANRVKVTIYGDDHRPARFHIRSVDAEAIFLIEDFSLYAGSIPASIKAAVWPWIEANRPELVVEWNRLNPDKPIA